MGQFIRTKIEIYYLMKDIPHIIFTTANKSAQSFEIYQIIVSHLVLFSILPRNRNRRNSSTIANAPYDKTVIIVADR